MNTNSKYGARVRAEQELARRADPEVAPRTTLPKQWPSASCMSDFEAYGAVCPETCHLAGRWACQREVRRAGVIQRAQLAALTARLGWPV